MSIVVDVIIIAVILLSVFLAYKKGLVTLAIGLVSFVIAVAVTVILYRPISNAIIINTGIDEMIENSIYDTANDAMNTNENSDQITNMIVDSAKQDLLPETARTLAENIVTGGVILILFIGVKIALKFVKALANIAAKVPVISQINKLGGIIYGLLRGVLIVYVALLLVSVAGQIEPDNSIHKSIEQSYIGKIMYENNVLSIFF